MSLQNIFAFKKTKSPVSKNPYKNYLRIFRLQHRQLHYKEQLNEALASWRQMSHQEKSAFYPRNFKSSYKRATDNLSDSEAESTKARKEFDDDTLSNAAAMTALVMATVSNTMTNIVSNAPAATPPPTPLPLNCKDNKEDANESDECEMKWPTMHDLHFENNNYQQQQQYCQQQDHEAPNEPEVSFKFMPRTPQNDTTTAAEQESNATHLDTLAKVSSWDLIFDGFYNPLEFVERLEELANLFQLDCDVLPSMMPMLLTRKALVWYRNSQRRWLGWSAFKRDLFNFFLPPKFEEQQANAIRQRRQRQGETIKNYVLSLQNLMRQTKLSELEQLERIYRNLLPELRLYIKRQDFRTLSELVTLGTECEEIRAQLFKCERRKTRERGRGRGGGGGTKHVPELDRDICRRCGDIGHWAHECPNQRKNYSWEYGNDYWTPMHTWYRKSDRSCKRSKLHKTPPERESVSTQSSDESSESANEDGDNDEVGNEDDDNDGAANCENNQRSKFILKRHPMKKRNLHEFIHAIRPESERGYNNNIDKNNNESKSSRRDENSSESEAYTTSSIPKRTTMYVERSKSA